jgi:predicted transcriptional regulator
MGGSVDAVDDVAFLAGSEPRAAVVTALAERGTVTKDELVEHSGASRVTVTRNLEQLADRGLVGADDGSWRLTPLGELLAGEFLSLLGTAGTADDLAPVLSRLPADAFDLDPAALAGADVTASTPANPYAPAERHGESLMAADTARMALPAVSPQLMADTGERLRAGDLEMELVASSSVAETFRTEIPGLVAEVNATGAVAIHEHGDEVPFYLGLVDDAVQVGVADDEGIPRALAETTDPEVRSWAEDTFEEYRRAAEPFEPDPAD